MDSSSWKNLLIIGRIVKAHGLKGECKVVPESDDPNRLLNLKRLWIGPTPQTARPYMVGSARLQTSKRGITALMRFSGINTVNDVQALGKLPVFAQLEDLPPLRPGEFFLHDLVGAAVVTDNGAPVGRLKDILDAPSYDIYVVERSGKQDALIPAVPEFVMSTDVNIGRIVIRPVDGLLD